MSARTMITLAATALWFWACQYYYTCHIKQVCADTPTERIIPNKTNPDQSNVASTDSAPLYFDYSDHSAFINPDKFPALKEAILRDQSEDNVLVIAGPYYADEKTPVGYDNMGIARAAKIRKHFPGLSNSKIRLEGKLLGDTYDASKGPFEGANFFWKNIEIKKAEVVEMENSAIMLFPYNSAQKENDPKIDAYLDKVAERVKKSGEKIKLTGYTDNLGKESFNKNLGLRRAKHIRNTLRKKGVKPSSIITESMGEADPVASNETEEGRHQNRRVVLEIN